MASRRVLFILLVMLSAAGSSEALARHSTITNLSTAPPPVPWPQGIGSTDAEFVGASVDGTHVFFQTQEPIAPEQDRDEAFDIYERHGSETRLVSTGDRTNTIPTQDGPAQMSWSGNSEDGEHAFFTTNESITSSDYDGRFDVYERHNGVTKLVSTNPGNVNGPHGAGTLRRAVSADGLRVIFWTTERLVPEDVDSRYDLYERSSGTTKLVTPGTAEVDAWFVGMSRDADHVFIETAESLVIEDIDQLVDIYELHQGEVNLVTPDPRYTPDPYFPVPMIFVVSRNGERAVFESDLPVTADDTDQMSDVYDYANGVTRLLTKPVQGIDSANNLETVNMSPHGERVYFESWAQLVPEDTDSYMDVYVHDGSGVSLLTRHPRFASFDDDRFERASDDGKHVFVRTGERMVPFPEDDDLDYDIYDVGGPQPVLISKGGDGDTFFSATSSDGTRLVLAGWDPLTPEDTDTSWDLYEYGDGVISLLSRPGLAGGGNVSFRNTTPDLSQVIYETREKLLASDTDGLMDVYEAGIASSQSYARPRGATPLRVSLVPAYESCVDPNTRHGAPLAFDACNPPVPASARLTVGTPEANGAPARSIGHVRLDVVVGNPATTADEADIRLELSLTDVRRATSLVDYEGEVEAIASLRLTDTLNGPERTDPATTMDFPLSLPTPCVATADESIGATCSIRATTDALVPGFMTEERRTVIKVSDVEVTDGGADDSAATDPNDVFAWQGVFVP
jgi:hypothetical protein